MSLPPTAIKTPPAAATAAGNPFAKAFRAEAAVWDLARQGKVKPMVVLSRLGPITILVGVLLKLFAGSEPTEPLLAPSSTVLISCVVGFLLPTLLFMVLDNKLNATAWAAPMFGAVVPNDDGSTSERERKQAFVRFPMSTYSSHALTGAGSWILSYAFFLEARAALASAALGLSFILMGLASFGWWASRRTLLHRLDNWLMETHLMSVAINVLSIVEPNCEDIFVLLWVVYAAYRLATFNGHGDLLVPSVLFWSSVILAVLYLGGSGDVVLFMLGVGGVHGGLVLKMYDTQNIGAWGTAAFHYVTAFGWTCFWAWSQTLPWPPHGVWVESHSCKGIECIHATHH